MRPDTHVPDPYVKENMFRKKFPTQGALPKYTEIKHLLPEPVWKGHENSIRCYWKTWDLAFENLRKPEEGTKFVSDFIDTAFNGNLFMWDSVFILMFGKYASHIFNFQETLDNFYSHQHDDGFISREIKEKDSLEMFERFDPSSTGPNIMAWSEWEYYLVSQDKDRLARVFPVLLAYNRWYRKNRTWQDGSYWSCGWGCGMDNQRRVSNDYSHAFDHGHNSWVDITLQQIFNDRILIDMAHVLKRDAEIQPEVSEMIQLNILVNNTMWDDNSFFYFDKNRRGKLGDVKSIGAFWALLANVVPRDRMNGFLDHLSNENEFNTPHPLPALSADDPRYDRKSGYWLGSVWAPTNYMVLKGLSTIKSHELAHKIGLKHNCHVTDVYTKTGTLWENYDPEKASPGNHAKPDFVGWTGLSSVTILFEYVFGITHNHKDNKLTWRVNLLEEHGIKNFFFGKNRIHMICKKRTGQDKEPVIEISAEKPITLEVFWKGGQKIIYT